MGAGIGFSRDAQSSARQNRSLRKRGEPYQTMKNNIFINAPKLKFKESSPEELKRLRKAFLNQKRLDQKKQLIVFIIVFSAIGLGTWLLLFK